MKINKEHWKYSETNQENKNDVRNKVKKQRQVVEMKARKRRNTVYTSGV